MDGVVNSQGRLWSARASRHVHGNEVFPISFADDSNVAEQLLGHVRRVNQNLSVKVISFII